MAIYGDQRLTVRFNCHISMNHETNLMAKYTTEILLNLCLRTSKIA
jgi:hypothetical protein